jgi:phosphoglycolate phosphatase
VIRCVVFDFDGTLLLSNDIKRDGFLLIARDVADGPAIMDEVLRQPPGDRVQILTRFAMLVGMLERVDEWVERYSSWCEQRLLVCPERAGASALLRQLRVSGISIHVNSATPTTTLVPIANRRFLPGTFDGVWGGHGRKASNLEAIAESAGLRGCEVVMVGDGLDDYQASDLFGCHFIGVAGGGLSESVASGVLVDDLRKILPLLDRIAVSHSDDQLSKTCIVSAAT